MKKKETMTGLFDASGCLTREALIAASAKAMTGYNLDQARKHLDSCELCRDALEGLSIIPDQERIRKSVAELDTRIHQKFGSDAPDLKESPQRLYRIWTAVSIAASIIILIGLYFLLHDAGKVQYDSSSLQDTNQQYAVLNPSSTVQEKAGKGPTGGELERLETDHETDLPQARSIGGVSVPEEKSETQVEPVAPEMEIAVVREDQEPADEIQNKMSPDEQDQAGQSENITQMKADVSVERTELIEPDEKPVTLGASATAFLKQTGKEEQKRQGETIVEESNIFITTDQPPRFPGGDDSLALYVSNNLHYPLTEQKGDTERKVHVSFVVEKDGSITHVEIRRGAGADFDQEAIRLVSSMPPWSPALQNNRPVRALYQMVIHFPKKE